MLIPLPSSHNQSRLSIAKQFIFLILIMLSFMRAPLNHMIYDKYLINPTEKIHL